MVKYNYILFGLARAIAVASCVDPVNWTESRVRRKSSNQINARIIRFVLQPFDLNITYLLRLMEENSKYMRFLNQYGRIAILLILSMWPLIVVGQFVFLSPMQARQTISIHMKPSNKQ